jgi:UrcA family protein
MKKTLLIAAALLASPGAAFANTDLPTREVRTADLDLTTAGGVARLEQRVARAARSLCENGMKGIQAQLQETACAKEVIEDHAPALALAVERANARKVRMAGTGAAEPGA